ncbi:MAG TPA: hypothetical protein VMU77_07940, partial [Acidimicrobiales bacterium]|nr:hypothetical protein [Acidimicrobiales bacterium]
MTETVGKASGAGLAFGIVFVLILLSGFSLSFGGCNFHGSSIYGAPVRDGLGIATSSDATLVATVDSNDGLLTLIKNRGLSAQVDVGGEST